MAAIGMLLVLVGWLVSLVGGIMVLIEAFKNSVVWGLASLFIPFVILVFVILNWDVSKKGFLISVVGMIIAVVGTALAAAFGGGTITPDIGTAM